MIINYFLLSKFKLQTWIIMNEITKKTDLIDLVILFVKGI
jgi:hypothetical protein